MSVNALRSHLAEFGLVVAKGISRIDELSELAENDPSLPPEARDSHLSVEKREVSLVGVNVHTMAEEDDTLLRDVSTRSRDRTIWSPP